MDVSDSSPNDEADRDNTSQRSPPGRAASALSIFQCLELSTEHLDEPITDWLSTAAGFDSSTYEGHTGWFAAACPDRENPGHTVFLGRDDLVPGTLARIFEFACAN